LFPLLYRYTAFCSLTTLTYSSPFSTLSISSPLSRASTTTDSSSPSPLSRSLSSRPFSPEIQRPTRSSLPLPHRSQHQRRARCVSHLVLLPTFPKTTHPRPSSSPPLFPAFLSKRFLISFRLVSFRFGTGSSGRQTHDYRSAYREGYQLQEVWISFGMEIRELEFPLSPPSPFFFSSLPLNEPNPIPLSFCRRNEPTNSPRSTRKVASSWKRLCWSIARIRLGGGGKRGRCLLRRVIGTTRRRSRVE